LPIATGLLLAMPPAVGAGAIRLLGTPAAPTAGRGLTGRGTVAALGPSRPEAAVAAFKQAAAQTAPVRPLQGRIKVGQ